MGKFEQEAKDLLAAIGGKENVTAVTHCATRMRFVLGDDKKADVKTIEAIPAVKGTFTNAGQFQVIIGNDVPIFYNDFTTVSGIEGVSKEAAKAAASEWEKERQDFLRIEEDSYIFLPDAAAVLSKLLPEYIQVQVYNAMLQSAASELGSRMAAMSAATDNATERIADLNLTYNKARQAQVTNEISEIVGGAAALE